MSTDFSDVQVFTGELVPKQDQAPAVLADATVQREIAEVQASITIAKRFPRNQAQALDRIQIACQRPGLAESALYSYARGGTDITGPSIRLAEAIAQQWGNLDFGIREIEQRNGESTVEAYAWDLETNTRQKKIFQVRHKRHTKAKPQGYDLTDPRDIYELVANQGARRLRACILGIIPGDIVEAAVSQCEQTLKAKADIGPEAMKKLVSAFENFSVTKEQIETRIQRKLDSITAAQVIALRKIYNSLKDGMSQQGDWFEKPPESPEQPKQEKKAAKAQKEAATASPAAPETQANGIDQTPATESTTGTTDDKIVKTATPEQIAKIRELTKSIGYPELALLDDYELSALEELDEDTANEIIKKTINLRG